MQVNLDAADLRPLVESVVAELAERLAPLDDRLAVDEREAARLLGIKPHVLRDARLRGEIEASRIGKRYLYARTTLARFLCAERRASR